MENLVVGQANLFAFILNSGNESKDLVLKIQTPDFKPNECGIDYGQNLSIWIQTH